MGMPNGISTAFAKMTMLFFIPKEEELLRLDRLSQTRRQKWLMKNIIVVLLVAVAVYTYRRKDWGDAGTIEKLGMQALIGAIVMAFAMGFYDGFFGPGTGSFLIFGFLYLGYDFVTAAGNAKALNFASGVGALVSFAVSGTIIWSYGLIMAAAMIAGAVVGTRLAIKKGASYVRPLYLLVTTLLIGKQVYEILLK